MDVATIMAEELATKQPDHNPHQANGDCKKTNFRYKNPRRSACSQVVLVLAQNWLLIDVGLVSAMPPLILGVLHRKSAETLCLNDHQASWFGSLEMLFHPIGSLASGYLQEKIGRRNSLVLINIPMLVAWLTLSFATSVPSLYAFCIIMGLSIGLAEAPFHSYIGEIAEPRLRGTLSTITCAAVAVGYLLVFVIAYHFDWRMTALICSACPVIAFVCMTQIPESPTHLILKNRMEDAQRSLSWARGWVKPEEVQEEFQSMVNYVQKSKKESNVKSHDEEEKSFVHSNDGCIKTAIRNITDKKVLLPLRLILMAFLITNATSLVGMKPYAFLVLHEYGVPIDGRLILIATSIFSFLGIMTNVVCIRRFGKRKLSLFTNLAKTASIFTLAIYCSFFIRPDRPAGVVYIPLVLSVVFNTFVNGLCISLLPYQLMSEIFPIKGRGTANGIAAAWAKITAFAMSKSFLYLKAWINLSGVMYFYGVVAFFGVVYYYFYLPETEGKSLEQIEPYFTKNHDRKEKFSMGKSV